MINARAETLLEKPSYRRPFQSQRCLVPAGGFYEWRRDGKGKQPILIRRRNQALIAFAGLWERWVDPTSKEPLETFTAILPVASTTHTLLRSSDTSIPT